MSAGTHAWPSEGVPEKLGEDGVCLFPLILKTRVKHTPTPSTSLWSTGREKGRPVMGVVESEDSGRDEAACAGARSCWTELKTVQITTCEPGSGVPPGSPHPVAP